MSLVRWSPFEEMEVMRRQMDRLVDQMMGRQATGGLPQLDIARALAPNIEVFTTDNDVVIKADLPGMTPENVTIEVTEDAVHLSGEMRQEEEVKEDNYFRSERQYGHFERLVPLPNRIKDADAKATFKHGVLTIRAPLAEEVKKPKARKLQIEA